MRVPDLAEELPFWTAGLGMKVLQSSAGVAVLGYGPEGKGTSAGGQFAIQLVEEGEEDSIKAPVGWQRIEMVLPYATDRVLNVEEAGGRLLPRWFGTANFVEVASPTGYVVRVVFEKPDAKVRYPITALVSCTSDLAASRRFYKDQLGMKEGGGLLSALPLVGGGSSQLRFNSAGDKGLGQPALVLEKVPDGVKPPKAGNKGLWAMEAVLGTAAQPPLAEPASASALAFTEAATFLDSLPAGPPPAPPAAVDSAGDADAPEADEDAPAAAPAPAPAAAPGKKARKSKSK